MILTPTMAQLPFIGALQAMFLSVPEIDFDFDGAAKLATKLPAIKERIRAELVEDMGKEVVFPERLTLPLSWSAGPEMVWHPLVSVVTNSKILLNTKYLKHSVLKMC